MCFVCAIALMLIARLFLQPALLTGAAARAPPPTLTMTAAFRNPNNLPTKVCVVCNRPFTWRKKWESSWDEITTCSKRCNSERKKSNRIARGAEKAGSLSDDEAAPAHTGILLDATAPAIESKAPPAAPSQLTVTDKVSVLASELGLDISSLPVVQAVAACNEKLGLPCEGTVAEQLDELLAQLSVGSVGSLGSEATTADDGDEVDPKSARKAAKKALKAQRRARREGQDTGGQKGCDLCSKGVDLLIRCQIDSTSEWKMVCGRCWKTPEVAGGVADGDGQNSHYRYGGLWKNLHRAA